jgi:hypothetical protein
MSPIFIPDKKRRTKNGLSTINPSAVPMQSNKSTKNGTNNKDGDGKNNTTTPTTSITAPATSSSSSTKPAASPSSKTTPTATTPPTPLPQATYAENLTCCVCMDDLQVDDKTFTRLTCCGQAMDHECWAKFQNSTMPQAQKDVCPQCRTTFPTSNEEGVKQVRVWVEKGKPWAQTSLGDLYRFGTGVPQSYEESIEYLNM